MIDLNMGGYATYVWTAYSITLVVFVINIFFSFRERQQVRKKIEILKYKTKN